MLEMFYEKNSKKKENGQKHHSCDRLILSVFLVFAPREVQMSANIGIPVDSVVVNDNKTPNDQKHNPIQDYEGERGRPNP